MRSRRNEVLVNTKIPELVKEHLSEEEQVISKISIRNTDVYATNKRLLRFTSKSKFDELEYDKISISFEKGGLSQIILRIFTMLLGVFCISLGILSYVGPKIGTISWKAPFIYSLLLCGMGLLLILWMLALPNTYYQIKYPGFSKKDLKNWRIMRNRWFPGKADRFAGVIKERTRQP